MSENEADNGQPERNWSSASNVAQHLEEISTHVRKHIGEIGIVLDEIKSHLIHLDILQIPATKERGYQVLVTSGVSDLPMKAPEGLEKCRRVELLIALPEDWPISKESFEDEANWWPIRWLKLVGRLPHENETWIWWGHTIPNGDPPEPIANTKFVGVMLSPPYWLPRDFFELTTKSVETITFYALIPLFAEEMKLKLEKGSDELEARFEKRNINFVIDANRPNVARKKGWSR
jgi:hypothetical protein